MNNYSIRIEIDDDELKQIFDEITAAQETIRNCYDRLIEFGVVNTKNSPVINKD